MSQLFNKVVIVGMGLIGGSMARRIRRDKLARLVVGIDADPAHRAQSVELDICDQITDDYAAALDGADLLVIAVPIGACGTVARDAAPYMKPGLIVTDVGSVKKAVIRDVAPALPPGVHFVPGHPIAGTEHSGPSAGFADVFEGRWTLLTPLPDTDPVAVERVAALWRAHGAMVETMEPAHHDQVLAITSHLPHMIAYTIVGTATDLGETLQQEVIQFSASGFRDFTRIAASDPVMWRDIFLNNKEAVLAVAQQFTEDLTALQRAIRRGEGDKLLELFTRGRAIRRSIIGAKQA